MPSISTSFAVKNPHKSALDMLDVYKQALGDLASHLKGNFDQTLRHLSHLEGTLIFSGVGKSGHIARKLASSFTSTGTSSVFIHPTEASHGDLGLLRPGDTVFVLSNSGETPELAPLIQRTQELAIPIIAITAGMNSSLAKAACYLLTIPQVQEICPLGLAPTTSAFLMLALGDILMSRLAQLKDLTPTAYKKFHPSGTLGFKLTTLRCVMRKGDALPCVSPEMKMSEALLIMTQKGAGCLAIVDDHNTLLGVISDGDLRRTMSLDLLEKKKVDIMTSDPVTVSADMRLDEAIAWMSNKKIHALLVTDPQRKLVGLATWHDCTSFERQRLV